MTNSKQGKPSKSTAGQRNHQSVMSQAEGSGMTPETPRFAQDVQHNKAITPGHIGLSAAANLALCLGLEHTETQPQYAQPAYQYSPQISADAEVGEHGLLLDVQPPGPPAFPLRGTQKPTFVAPRQYEESDSASHESLPEVAIKADTRVDELPDRADSSLMGPQHDPTAEAQQPPNNRH
ncbi:hypothetical protein LTR56_005442 [Elasticomyces elasticus]|nr:hypothetical protein LTR22_015260 [Elasticomyces elasticus]KAK3651933.1 hypothetical protein LTR56_005442 [Elasticomyces elasticus]KAK4927828.1 hypothetical protein LTR49_005454 [Elasticomyces elasticus]KAK5750896.1 hypothetical protein LTS12_019039 [Elasticomyces elasticus]